MTPPDGAEVPLKRRRNGVSRPEAPAATIGRPANAVNSVAAAADKSRPLDEQSETGTNLAVIEAHVDDIDIAGHLCGWAWVPDQPSRRVAVTAYLDDEVVSFGAANSPRDDVRKAGYGDGRYGFSLALPDKLLDGGMHRLSLQFESTDSPTLITEVERNVPGRPPQAGASTGTALAAESDQEPSDEIAGAGSELANPIGAAAPAAIRDEETTETGPIPHPFRCFIDEITDSEVTGWIFDPMQASRRCTVGIKDGDRLVSRAVASIFRQDLQTAQIGDGCHAFSLPMPRSLLDGNDHRLNIVDLTTGIPLNDEPILWRSGAGTGGAALRTVEPMFSEEPVRVAVMPDIETSLQLRPTRPNGSSLATGIRPTKAAALAVTSSTRILFDVSDLIYYIGHHPNLTGIQRVQSSIVLATAHNELVAASDLVFISFNARIRKWVAIPTGFLVSLLDDLFLPQEQRLVRFPAEDARYGTLPGAREVEGSGLIDSATPSVLCLLGAAWVQRDYFHRVLHFKRRYGTRFVMTVHDLIPIYARETCDQGTARVFEEFLRRALRHVDHFLSVSENTSRDLVRYARSLSLPEPPITVTRNGSSFDEFLPKQSEREGQQPENLPSRFVLFVATIEGRKNHRLVFDLWRRMLETGDEPPYLVCVGRVGWKSESFIADLVETNYLDGRVILMQDVSDAQLRLMYDRSLFTLCPSLYEGWGLPIGESLAAGKICVCSERASLPEVAGEFGVYIDIDDFERSLETVRGLITDHASRKQLEAKIRRGYRPITWRSVAENVVTACRAAARREWQEPYPYAAVPYSTEVSFAWLGREAQGSFGDDLLAQIVDARRGHFLREPLQEQSFLRGEEVRTTGSWGEPENWGTWLCQGSGELALGLGPHGCDLYYVFLRLRAPGPLSELPIRLSANGETMWAGTLGPRPRDIHFPVRRRPTGPGGWRLRLRADVDLSPELRNEIAAIDGRVPVLGFERLVIVPEDDLKTRLDILYTLLL